MLYCLVRDGVVVDGPRPLPENWESVSRYDLLDDPARYRADGWLPFFELGAPAFDQRSQELRARLVVDGGSVVRRTYDVVALTPEEIAARPVPEEVTRYQAIAALVAMGAMAEGQSCPAPLQDQMMRLYWQHSPVFRRRAAAIRAIVTALGWSEGQGDAWFRQAGQIPI